MYLFGITHTPLTATLGALSIGIGVEFTVLLMMRYYEERGKGEGVVEAMTTAITKIGRAILASGVTTIGGFGALLIASDFPIIQEFGIVTLINVFFALMSTLFVLATTLVLVDSWHERRKVQKIASSALIVPYPYDLSWPCTFPKRILKDATSLYFYYRNICRAGFDYFKV